MAIQFICDSTCDVDKEEAARIGLKKVPLKVVFAEEEFLDGDNLEAEEFYRKLVNSEKLPTTSQPSPEAFLQHFEEAKAAGNDVVCLVISSKLSGTYQSAMIAKEMAEYDRIFVIDTESASPGVQYLLSKGMEMSAEGRTAEEIVSWIEENKKRVHIYFAVDTLEYLYKGGRLSAAGKNVGTLLNLKPLIVLQDGVIHVAAMARGNKSAWEKMVKLMEADGVSFQDGYYACYTGEKALTGDFFEFLEKRTGKKADKSVAVGSVLGVHVGPGVRAVAGFSK